IVEIIRIEEVLDRERPEIAIELAAKADIHDRARRNHRLDVELVVVHAAGADVTHDAVKCKPLPPDVPRYAEIAGPARDQRHIVAREQTLTEHGARVGEAALEPDVVIQTIAYHRLRAIAAGRIKVDIVGFKVRPEPEMDFVLQPHIVDARLNVERGEMKTYAGLHITGFLRSQIECRRHAVFRRDHADTLIHVRDTEALRHATEDGELLVEPVLRAKVECAIELALVQWNAGLIAKA